MDVEIIVPLALFLSIAATIILRGPLGKALGDRLAGRVGDRDRSAETDALRGEMEELRYRLSEVEERLDFTERVLARHRQADPKRIEGNQ